MRLNFESWHSMEILAQIYYGALAGAKRVVGSNRIPAPEDIASQVLMNLGGKEMRFSNAYSLGYQAGKWRAISELRMLACRRKAERVKAAAMSSTIEAADSTDRDELRQQLVEAMLATRYGVYVFGRYVLDIPIVAVGEIIDAKAKPRTHQLRLHRALRDMQKIMSGN